LNASALPSQLESILNDIDRSIEARLFYPAVLTSLTIPDICMALTLPANQSVKPKHYIYFVDTYAYEQGLGVSGEDCYRLRGGVMHRGDFKGHPQFDWTHVLFSLPESTNAFHGISVKSYQGDQAAAMLDLQRFCNAMKEAVCQWYGDNKENNLVRNNLSNIISFRPQGVNPFCVGTSVVASGE